MVESLGSGTLMLGRGLGGWEPGSHHSEVRPVEAVTHTDFFLCLPLKEEREFPGSPVDRTLCIHCRRCGFDPWSGNKNPPSMAGLGAGQSSRAIGLVPLEDAATAAVSSLEPCEQTFHDVSYDCGLWMSLWVVNCLGCRCKARKRDSSFFAFKRLKPSSQRTL